MNRIKISKISIENLKDWYKMWTFQKDRKCYTLRIILVLNFNRIDRGVENFLLLDNKTIHVTNVQISIIVTN